MELLREYLRRLQMLFSRREQLDRDLEEEMLLHRDLRARENREAGLKEDQARYAAQRRFGNTLRLREEIHEEWSWSWLDNLSRDIRYGLRRLRQQPGFTTVAVLTLALGIGANTAVFTLVNAILLRSLPVSRPEELWSLGDDKQGGGGGGFFDDVSAYSYPEYQFLKQNSPEFSELAAFQAGTIDLSVRRSGDQRPPDHFHGELVSGNYFAMLGVGAYAGRTIRPSDDAPEAPPVAMMSYRVWHDFFASNPSVIGETFIVKGVAVHVIGIASPGFFGETLRVNPPDFWLPLNVEPLLMQQGSQLKRWNEFWLYSIGRLHAGFEPSAVQAHVTTELRQWINENYSDPRYRQNVQKQHIVLQHAARGVSWMRDRTQSGLLLLMAVSGMVLLIACANIANLLMARGTASRAQIAVRVALGATRAHIVHQTVIEGLILALLGGSAGAWMAIAASHFLLLINFRGAEYVPIDAVPSLLVLLFTGAISLLTGLIFSVAPAWIASRVQPIEPLRGTGRSTAGGYAGPQKYLVVLQAAISLVLLVGAGLLSKSLSHLENQHFGFETEGRLLIRLDPPTQYSIDRLQDLYRNLELGLAKVPGVRTVSISFYSPMDFSGWDEPVSINGQEIKMQLPHGKWPWQNRVSAHYFDTLGIRILRGRAIDEYDLPQSQHVAVVNQAFAETFFPHEDAIGKHFGIEEPAHSGDYQIVGIAEDAKYSWAQDRFDPMFYLPLLQQEGKYEDSAQAAEQRRTHYIGSIQLRLSSQQNSVEPMVRRTLSDIDPSLTVTSMRTFADQVSLNFTSDQLLVRLTTVYGLLALILASIGLYGVASYTVARRVNEIGIRMALGANRSDVVKLVVSGAMRLIEVGLAIGVPVALMAGHAIGNRLYGVRSYDPFVLGSALIALTASAAVAVITPARRAASIDPMQALRME